MGATNQALTLQGSASTTVTATGGGFTTTMGFTGTPTGAVRYNFDRAAAAGTYTVCTTAGNCAGSGGGVTTSGGSTNRVAKFTGSQTLGDSSLSDNGTLVSTTGNLTVQGGTATVGVANSQTGVLSLAYGSANFSGSLTQGTLTASRTYTLPDASGTVCLSSGNCLGGGGGGANTALSNLSSVAINTSLLPGGTTIDLGSATAPFRNLYIAGSSATPGTNNFTITGAATAPRTITLPDASGTICLNNAVSCGFATGSGMAFTQGGNTVGATGVLGTNDNNGLNIRTNGNTALALDTSGNGVLTGNLTINGTSLSSAGALNITPGSSLTVGATAQTLTLQGNASSTLSVTGGGFATTVGFTGSPVGAVTYSFDRTVAAGSYTICTSIGNCAGSGSGVTTVGGTNGTIAMFTGTQSIANSLLSQSGGTVAVNGNLNLTSGNNYQINGTQISSANLSNDANIAKLSASQTFSGATLSFKNSGSDSANAFNIQNTGGNALFTANTTAGTIILGTSGALDGKLVFSNVSNSNTTTILPGTPTANRTITLPNVSGTVCLDSGNCAGAGATLQTGYNFSAGGTTPKIKLNSTLNGVDIQDADTTIGVDLLDVRASNGSGLGAVLFGVGNTGQITMKNSSNSATALSVLTQGGTRVLSVDTSAGAVVLGQGGTLAGTLVLNNATNSNKGTVITSALGQDTIYTLPDPVAGSATICLNTGNCLGGGGGANSALSNLSGVAINTALLPGSAGAINLGSGTLPFGKLFLAGTSSTPGTNNFQITGVATAARTITLPDASGTVCLAGTAACGFTTGTGAAFVNNGNAFGAAAVLGTNDANSLTLQTSSAARLTIAANGSNILLGSNTDLIMQGATAYISNTQGSTRGESFGDGAVATGDAVAVGYNASSFFQGVAIGSTSSNNSTGGVAIGYAAQSGYLATAIGSQSNAAQESVAIGVGALTNQHNSIAIGNSATVNHLSSIVLGQGATDAADNQFVVGADGYEITEMYVGSGVTDATPTGFVLQGTGGAGSNVSGANVTLAGGKSTGSAAGGNLNFAISKGTGSSSTLNSLTTVATFSGTDGSFLLQNATDSASAFKIVNAANSEVLFTADTTARGAGGGNRIKIGNSTGTNGGLTLLQLDSTSTDPTSNLGALNGSLFYNSNTNKVSLIENGQIKVICNTVDLGCGTGTVTLQSAYGNSTGGTTSEIIADATRGALDIQDRSTTNGGTIGANLLNVRATAATDATAGAAVFSVGNTGATLFKNTSDQNNAFQVQNTGNVALLSVSTLAGTGSSVQLYAPNANNTISTEGIWLRAPKNAVTTLFGNNDSVASYTVNDSSANLRFNGSGVAWGDMGYYPQGGGDGNYGQFRFSTASAAINSTPNAKVGVGDLYVAGKLGVGTTSPIAQLHVAGLLPASAAQNLSLSIDLPYDIEIRGRYLYAAVSGKMRVFDISRPTSMSSIGSVNTGSGVATLAVSGHYAYVSVNSGTMYAIDISNPGSPTVTATTAVSGIVALTVQGRYMYASTSDSSNNIKVFDLANPASPVLVASLAETNSGGFLVADGRYLYTTMGLTGNLVVIDISNPAVPTNVSTSLALGSGYAVRAVQGRYAYAVSGSNLRVVDITNPASPTVTSTTATGSGSYDVAIQGRYAYIALDSSGNGIQVMDISNPTAPASIGTIAAGSAIRSVYPNGRYIYAANYGSPSLDSYDMGGAYIQQLEVGGIQASTISADGRLTVGGDGYVQGSLNIGRDATVNGNIDVTGAAAFQNTSDSLNAFSVKNAAGMLQMNLSTSSQTNEITNGDLEGNTTNGWSLRGTADQLQTATTPVKFGHYSVHVRTLGAANNGIQYSIALKPSTQYTLSLWARRDNSSAASFNMGRADNGSDSDCLTNQTITTTWTQFTCTFTTGSTVGSASNVYFKQTDTSTDEVYIDGATLSQSSTAINYQTPSSGLEVASYYNNISLNGSSANPEVQPWQLNANNITTNGSTAANRSRAGSIAYNGYMYVIGGGTGVDGNTVAASNNALYAKINADGSVGSFAATTNLNTGVSSANAIVINGYMYLVGGKTADNLNTGTAIVQYARINSDGTLGTWSQTTAAMPAARSSAGIATLNSYLYVTGGQDNAGGGGQNTYYYAKVNADGNITAWNSGALPTSPSAHGTFINNGYLYTVGSDLFNTTVYNYAPVLANGSVGSWTSVANMPTTGLGDAGFTTMNGYAYILGGWNGSALVNSVYYAPFNVDGTLGTWTQAINNLPRNVENNTAFTYNGYMYNVGGDISGGTVTPTIYYASGPRTRLAGSLDLTAGSSKNLSNTDGGGTLTAGDTNIVGSLQVQGNASFKQSVSVGASLTVGGEVNAGSFSGAGLSDCDSSNSKLLYDATTKQFSCGTDRASGFVRKVSDESLSNNTTLQPDNELTFTVTPGETYFFQMSVNATFASTGGIKYSVTGPTGSTCNISSHGMDSGGGSAELRNYACGTGAGQTGTYGGSDVTDNMVITGSIIAGAGGGTSVTLQWAQGTTNGTATVVKAGSILTYYKVTGADLAEVYYSNDHSVSPGDVVQLDSSLQAGVKKTSQAYEPHAVGIVSTRPGNVLGDDQMAGNDGTPVLLALSGRIPVNVSMENGAIKAGDYLTPSSTPGYAMKATQPGQMVGKAMEDFSLNDPHGTGKILAFANLTYANPDTGVTANNDVQGSTMTAANMNVSGTVATQNLTVAGTATVKNLIVGTMTTTKELAVTGNATFGGDINLSGVGQSRNAITKKFKASKPIAIGSVVIADRDNDGQVTTTTTPNDTRVLGIALTEAHAAGDEVTVAIGGSVQVRTVTGASIQGGDLLTSSGEEGVAEKSSAPTPGSLLGKALGKPIDDMTWLLITLN
ncbi:MAG TPA: carbohydrate binding domain-containing protein [Candidatus Saccharimonadales bacterium]|nr:carbohydrate binding domain-containing protein [Candidatus Saccharimonadales bacterium]